jgi:hypothetical protein
MKRIIFIILYFFSALSFGQQQALIPFFSKAEKWETGQFVGKDNFGNFYSIYENEFKKITPSQVFFYKNVSLGKIYQVDLQNPLQIVLFYKQFTTAVLVDNQLNETTLINFSELQEPLNPEAVSLASQNRLWIYDMLSQKLGLFDIQKNTFQALTPSFKESLQFYQSDYNYFYWLDTKQNLYVSNLFGKVNFLGQIPESKQLQIVSPKQVLMKIDNELFLYNLENSSMSPITLNEKSFNSFSFKDQILSIFTENEIKQYKITLP